MLGTGQRQSLRGMAGKLNTAPVRMSKSAEIILEMTSHIHTHTRVSFGCKACNTWYNLVLKTKSESKEQIARLTIYVHGIAASLLWLVVGEVVGKCPVSCSLC